MKKTWLPKWCNEHKCPLLFRETKRPFTETMSTEYYSENKIDSHADSQQSYTTSDYLQIQWCKKKEVWPWNWADATDNWEKQIAFHSCVRLKGSLLLPERAKHAWREHKHRPHSYSFCARLLANEGRMCVCLWATYAHKQWIMKKKKRKKTQVFILTLVYHLGDYLIATIASF